MVYNLNHFLATWIWGGKFSSIWSSILRWSCYFSKIFCDFIICHGIFICHHLLRTTDNKIGICCISTKHTEYFGARSKTCYARKRDNKLEWSDMPQGLPYLVKTGRHDSVDLRVKNIVYSHTWKIHQFMQKQFTARYLYLYKTLFTHILLYLVHTKTSLTTKHLHTKKTGGELGCSGRVGSSCSTSGTRQVTLVTNPEFTTTGTFPLSFVTQIFCNDWPIHGGDDKTF